ncbi:MAG: class I SAM-dependent methyltransferase [Phycisphaeraceae bacterium]|nr:class I SAM-dependent methyltransferase [Phycisphaeraceae bacterium]
MSEAPATTNYDKFQTGNPLVQWLIRRFYRRIGEAIGPATAGRVFDAGCGEGESLDRLKPQLGPATLIGADLGADSLQWAARRHPAACFTRQDLRRLALADNAADLTLCLEVLEHVPEPDAALAELLRVTSDRLVLSVPHEPWFRLGSLARGKYVSRWGNHPEHINHWNPRSFRRWLAPHCREVEITRSFPWIIARCRP